MTYTEEELTIIAESKAFRERVKLSLTALPLIQFAGLAPAMLS
jgi:hypothetical protein